jgi:hypothetical protein
MIIDAMKPLWSILVERVIFLVLFSCSVEGSYWIHSEDKSTRNKCPKSGGKVNASWHCIAVLKIQIGRLSFGINSELGFIFKPKTK